MNEPINFLEILNNNFKYFLLYIYNNNYYYSNLIYFKPKKLKKYKFLKMDH
jgi:hypothetical protein